MKYDDKIDRKKDELRRLRRDIRKSVDIAFKNALFRNAVIMSLEDEEILLDIAKDYTKFIHSDIFFDVE